MGSHEMSYSPEYAAWSAMKQRCTNPNMPNFKDYGARGITVCDQWMESFTQFFRDMGPRPDGHSIERKDNSGNYTPENCKWATKSEQNRNQRRSAIVEIDGVTKSLRDWSEQFGIDYEVVRKRRRLGWDYLRALTEPANPIRTDNTTGFRGVSFRKDRQKFSAQIHINGECIRLGCYDTAEEAAKAYEAKKQER